MGIIEGLTALGLLILGPGAAAAAAMGIAPAMVGAGVAGAGAAAVVGGAGAAGSAANPFVLEGIENASADAHNNVVSGAAGLINGLQIPGVPFIDVN